MPGSPAWRSRPPCSRLGLKLRARPTRRVTTGEGAGVRCRAAVSGRASNTSMVGHAARDAMRSARAFSSPDAVIREWVSFTRLAPRRHTAGLAVRMAVRRSLLRITNQLPSHTATKRTPANGRTSHRAARVGAWPHAPELAPGELRASVSAADVAEARVRACGPAAAQGARGQARKQAGGAVSPARGAAKPLAAVAPRWCTPRPASERSRRQISQETALYKLPAQ